MLNIFLMIGLALVTNFSLEEANPTAKAATQLIQMLSSQQRNECQFEFEDPQRTHWMFLPGDRAGLPLREMSPGQQ